MSVLDTNESRTAFARHVVYRTWVYDDERPWGHVYTCPRCSWQSRGMRWKLGAVYHGERHALDCKGAS